MLVLSDIIICREFVNDRRYIVVYISHDYLNIIVFCFVPNLLHHVTCESEYYNQ